MDDLRDVVGILDMDGFSIEKKFYCKELGILRVGDASARSYFFNIGVRWADLSQKDRRTCAFVTRNIHRLPFGVPAGVAALPLDNLEDIVVELYRGIVQNERSCIAYKGGHYERDLLAKLAIPGIDLEKYGCPKAQTLIHKLVWRETCGQHLVPDAFGHCPKVEVEAYAQWLRETLFN